MRERSDRRQTIFVASNFLNTLAETEKVLEDFCSTTSFVDGATKLVSFFHSPSARLEREREILLFLALSVETNNWLLMGNDHEQELINYEKQLRPRALNARMISKEPLFIARLTVLNKT